MHVAQGIILMAEDKTAVKTIANTLKLQQSCAKPSIYGSSLLVQVMALCWLSNNRLPEPMITTGIAISPGAPFTNMDWFNPSMDK